MPDSLKNYLDAALNNEKVVHDYIRVYSKKTETFGLKKLLSAIADQEKEHELQLQELLSASVGSGDSTNEPAEISMPRPFSEISMKNDNPTPKELLGYLLAYYEKTGLFYQSLAHYALNTEQQIGIKRLIDGENKLRQWTKDRYDLELL